MQALESPCTLPERGLNFKTYSASKIAYTSHSLPMGL